MQLVNRRTCVKDMWVAVRQLTDRSQNVKVVDGIAAESLNQHYAQISAVSAEICA